MRKLLLTIFTLFVLITMLNCLGCSSKGTTIDGDESEMDIETDGDDDLDLDAEPEAEPETDMDHDGDVELEDEAETEDDSNDELVQEKIDLGVFWLQNTETELANQAFKEAFDLDSENPQARFGYAFTEAMVGFDMFFMMVQAIEGQIGTTRKSSLKASYPGVEDLDEEEIEDINHWFDEIVFDIMELIDGHFLRAVELYQPLKESGGLSITFEHLPIHIGIDEYTWIEGEIDDADVFIFDAMARMGAAVFELIKAHTVRSDLYGVVTLVANNSSMLDDINVMTAINLVTYLLNYDERFLSLREDDGVEIIQGVGDLLIGALEDNILAAQAAEKEFETDEDQTDEAFSVIKDKDELVFVMNVWRHDEELDKDRMDSIPLINPEIIVAMSTLKNHLENGGDPVPFDNTLALVMSSALMIPVGYGLLDYLGFSPKDLLDIEYSNLEPSVLTSLLLYILNMNVVALDLHTYFETPFGLRDVLPLWSSDKGDFNDNMYFEWECPAELEDDELPDGSGTLLCAGSTETVEDTMVDAAHFQSLPDEYAIDADGKTYTSPYIAWQDPTFGNVLYLNMKALKLDGYPDEPKWQPADQFSFNYAFGKILGGVLGFIPDKKDE